jgi:prevent-host-death family protein
MMEEPVSAADANRNFSQLLRAVREERASYIVTSHGKPVARIVPFEADATVREPARAALVARLKSTPVSRAGRWKREDLYKRGK